MSVIVLKSSTIYYSNFVTHCVVIVIGVGGSDRYRGHQIFVVGCQKIFPLFFCWVSHLETKEPKRLAGVVIIRAKD